MNGCLKHSKAVGTKYTLYKYDTSIQNTLTYYAHLFAFKVFVGECKEGTTVLSVGWGHYHHHLFACHRFA